MAKQVKFRVVLESAAGAALPDHQIKTSTRVSVAELLLREDWRVVSQESLR